MHFIQEIEPAEGSRSAVFRNAACHPKLPLASTFEGLGTCWETFQRTVRACPDSASVGARPGDGKPYSFLSYSQMDANVRALAAAMQSADSQMGPGSTVGIFGINSPEWIQAMVATSAISAVCVPLYDTLGPQASAYIMRHASLRTIFVQDRKLASLLAAVKQAGAAAAAAAGEVEDSSWAALPPLQLQLVVVWDSHGGTPDLSSSGEAGLAASTQALRALGVRVEAFLPFLTPHLPHPAGTSPVAKPTSGALGPRPTAHALHPAGPASSPPATPAPLGSGPGQVAGLADRAASHGGLEGAWPTEQGGAGRGRGVGLQPPAPSDIATIMYSSGTTGLPKGVVLTHRALVSVVASMTTFMRDPWGLQRLAARQQLAEQQQGKPAGPGAPLPLNGDSGARLEVRAGGEGGPQGGLRIATPAEVAAAVGWTGPLERLSWPSFEAGDSHLSYLPLAHIYERLVVEAALALGATIGCWQGLVDKLQDDARALRPAIFVGVPRVWQRVMEGVTAKLAARTPIARGLFRMCYQYKLKRVRAGVAQHAASPFSDLLVFRKVQAALGGKLKLVISGAAPLPQEQEEFIRTSLCCNAGQGYGLTETCSASAVALPDRPDMMGTVGPVQTCADFCVESVPEMGYDARAVPIRGELLLRGPCLFSSYWRDPVGTREVLDEGGWFHTGDIVEVVEPSGALRIIDRKKNLVKLAQGEYVAVEAVETCLLGRTQDMVQALWVYGDPLQRRLVAVAVPHKHYLQAWADRVKVGSGEGGSAEGGAGGLGAWQRLCASPDAAAHVLELLQSAAKAAQLNSISTPAAVHLEPSEWTPETGLLTPTHKLKRHALRAHYASALQRMYSTLP